MFEKHYSSTKSLIEREKGGGRKITTNIWTLNLKYRNDKTKV